MSAQAHGWRAAACLERVEQVASDSIMAVAVSEHPFRERAKVRPQPPRQLPGSQQVVQHAAWQLPLQRHARRVKPQLIVARRQHVSKVRKRGVAQLREVRVPWHEHKQAWRRCRGRHLVLVQRKTHGYGAIPHGGGERAVPHALKGGRAGWLEWRALRADRLGTARTTKQRINTQSRDGAQKLAPPWRERYSSVRVSTMISSPTLMNIGTLTTAPVSSVAGLEPPAGRRVRMPRWAQHRNQARTRDGVALVATASVNDLRQQQAGASPLAHTQAHTTHEP